MKKSALFKHHAVRIGLSLLIVPLLLLNVVNIIHIDFLQRLENYTYDLRLQWTMPGTVDRRIVIVDIDEKSLQKQGRWPWSRYKMARMVDTLFDHYKIDVLGFDIVFAEHDDTSGLDTLERLEKSDLKDNLEFKQALSRLRPSLRYDQIFADSLKNRRIALGYYFHHGSNNATRVGELPAPVLAAGSFDVNQVGAVPASGYTANLPLFQRAAPASGFFNADPLIDSDGVFRRISLLKMMDKQLYETLSLAVVRLALRESEIKLNYEGDERTMVALESLQVGHKRIPVDADVAAPVPFRGKQGSFVYVSANDVLQSKVPPDTLRGAIVLVGTTAPGLLDLRTVPMQESYAGVELHANMIAGILDSNIKELPALVLGLELVLLFGTGCFLALVLPLISPLGATVLTGLTMLIIVAVNIYCWQSFHIILPMASGLVLVSGLFVFNMSYGFFVDSRGKRLLAHLFGQYVPPELVDEMAQHPESYSLAGSSRELTVLFSDVRGFTTISEGLDPEQLTQLMNEFLTTMTKVIHHHRGTIDKYMGDAIMAFWGAPLHDPHHAKNALEAAMGMIAELDSLQDHFKSKGWPPIKIGVGLNTGDMVVGNMGSEFRLAYTVMGDAVNLGSRLESLTKEYGVQILLSEFTMAAVPDYVFRELDSVRVKGKDKPVRIFEPVAQSDQLTDALRSELAMHAQALSDYRTQQWQLAALGFAQLQAQCPGRKIYSLYANRIAHFVENPPPPDWDGTYTFTTK